MKRRDPIGRSVEVLRYLAEQPDQYVGVGRIAQALDAQQSTISRLLATLLAEGIVDRDGTHGGYRVGEEVLRIAQLAATKYDPAELAQPVLDALAATHDESVFFALYSRGRRQMIRVATRATTRPLQYAVPLNEWTEIYRGASGLGILAFLPESEREAVVQLADARATADEPFLAREQLESFLDEVRERGAAITHGRRITGAVGIAAPVFSGRGHVLGDVIVTVPQERLSPERETAIVNDVIRSAAELTRRMTAVSAID